MASGVLFPSASFTRKPSNCRGFGLPARNSVLLLKGQKFFVRSSLDKDVSDMSVNGNSFLDFAFLYCELCFSMFYVVANGPLQYTLFSK